MKRIKQIIEALRVLSATPSDVIINAWGRIKANVEANSEWAEQHMHLVDTIMSAVAGLAQEMERKPAQDGEAKS